jgi:hypothetical protein
MCGCEDDNQNKNQTKLKFDIQIIVSSSRPKLYYETYLYYSIRRFNYSSFFLFKKTRRSCNAASNSAISITGIHEADTLKGTISAQIAIAGLTQLSKIEVYANDSLVATSNKAPYSLQWNTLGVTIPSQSATQYFQ